MILRIIGLAVFLVGLDFTYFSVSRAKFQEAANHHFVAVPATINDAHLEAHRGSKSTSYTPSVNYTYVYDDTQYSETRIVAVEGNGDRTTAQMELDCIAHESAAEPDNAWRSTAYVNPEHPEQSILVRSYSFDPYLNGMIGMSAMVVGTLLMAGLISKGRTNMQSVALDESGWVLLLPRTPLRKALRNAWIYWIAFTAAILPMPIHWTFVARQSGTASVSAWMTVLLVMACLGTLVYRRWSVCRHMSDARLSIRPAPARRGATLAIRVEWDAYVPLRVTRVTARVLCLEHYRERRGNKTVGGTRPISDQAVSLSSVEIVTAGQTVDGEGELRLGTTLPASSKGSEPYPYYNYEIRLNVVLERMVDYNAVFPLDVC